MSNNIYNILRIIDNDNQVITPFKKDEVSGYCDDCYRITTKLMETDACADHGCCYKNVCRDGCRFICFCCGDEIEDPYRMGQKGLTKDYRVFIHCDNCADQDKYWYEDHSVYGIIYWSGISEYEYYLRYG
jgi:hypothetical protein